MKARDAGVGLASIKANDALFLFFNFPRRSLLLQKPFLLFAQKLLLFAQKLLLFLALNLLLMIAQQLLLLLTQNLFLLVLLRWKAPQ